MDRTKNPRGQIVENLDDFNYWLDHMFFLASEISKNSPIASHQLNEKIKEARLITTEDWPKIQSLINEIDSIQGMALRDELKFKSNENKQFQKRAREFKFLNEQKYGEEAINIVLADLERRIKQFDELPDSDEGKLSLNRSLDYVRHDLKKGDYKTIWVELYRIEFNLNENSNYFYRVLDKKGLSKGGKPSPYRDNKKEIIEIIRRVLLPKSDRNRIYKNAAKARIAEFRYGVVSKEAEAKKLSHGTLKKWIEQYEKTGDIDI